ncbi:MAG: hypothetical protein U0U70_03345 [Chitinophagaceae bacterium]
MSKKNILREEYNRLKKAVERILKSKHEKAKPQLVWQPVRNNKY